MPSTNRPSPGVGERVRLGGRSWSWQTPFSARQGKVTRGGGAVPNLAGKLAGRLRFTGNTVLLLSFVMCGPAVWAQPIPDELGDLSLERLISMKITSVARKPQTISKSATAVYVITQEDIRRSGATSIPEALRMAPGVQVAQITNTRWAIGVRGFNAQFSNKLLVLFDGRSVYTPLFSGVHWDMQDVLLEDIERIEVIRGPGATMWGSNAVNGVINIITKTSSETQGSLVSAGGGNQEKGFGGLRFGAKLGEHTSYRIYSKYFQRAELATVGPESDWEGVRGGFRLDWNGAGRDSLTVQGDFFDGDAGESRSVLALHPPFARLVSDRLQRSAGNLLGRWTRQLSDSSETTLQLYYDRTQRAEIAASETRDTLDMDFQHRSPWGRKHEVVWGLAYRFSADRIGSSLDISFMPSQRKDSRYSTFLQDEWSLLENKLAIVSGVRFEHNGYSGLETQPSVRLLWSPNARHTGWASLARAVRSPSRFDHDLRVNFGAFPGPGGLNVLALMGDPQVEAEDLLAYELGYRLQWGKRFSIDLASFYNDYENLIIAEPARPFFEASPSPPHTVIPVRFANRMSGESYGAEVSANYSVTDHWRLSGSYSWLKLNLHPQLSTPSQPALNAEGESPEHSVSIRSYLNLPGNLQLDAALYDVASLPALAVPRYTRVDVRLGWRPKRHWDFSVAAQNLLDNRHPEFLLLGGAVRSQVKRSVYGKITRRF